MEKVLLVEDDPIIQKLYGHNLTKSGYKVMLAKDGEEALTRLEDSLPDIILCDINMPRMDGFQFRAEVVKNEEYKEIPFIFLTARSSEEDTIHGLDLDADDYIAKGTPPQVVIAKMKTMLRRRSEVKSTLTHELATASAETSVQLIPSKPPPIKGYSVLHWHKAHEGVPGGDFIDYIRLDEGRWLIVIGDVMGKRWKAWMFAHSYVGYLRSSLRVLALETEVEDLTPARILTNLNQLLFRDDKVSDVLCTLSLVILDANSGVVKLSNAAHLPALHYKARDGSVHEVRNESLFLGIREETEYVDVALTMEHDDRMLLFTDGLIESANEDGEQFGIEAVSDVFLESSKNDIIRIAPEFQRTLSEFTGNSSFDDDLTLICIQRNQKGGSVNGKATIQKKTIIRGRKTTSKDQRKGSS